MNGRKNIKIINFIKQIQLLNTNNLSLASLSTTKVYNDAGGNRIFISSSDGTISTAYMHLDEVCQGIKEGMNIFEGQQIGTMGKSGFGKQEYEKYLSHLHYEI